MQQLLIQFLFATQDTPRVHEPAANMTVSVTVPAKELPEPSFSLKGFTLAEIQPQPGLLVLTGLMNPWVR